MEEEKKPRVSKEVANRYKRKVRYTLPELNRNTDLDIIEHLEKQENKRLYIKNLIRKDIESCKKI